MIIGIPEITDGKMHSIIMKYYRDSGDGYIIGPPVEALETLVIEPTGKWRIVGDVDDQQMEIEVDADWKETPRAIKWRLGWPMMYVEEMEPDIHGTTVWVSEKYFNWMTPANEYLCGCKQNRKEENWNDEETTAAG